MNKYYYKKGGTKNTRAYIRIAGLFISLIGIGMLVYFALPIGTSYFMLQNVYASQNLTTPIPTIKVLTKQRIQSLLATAVSGETTDYTDAKLWFPSFEINPATPRIKGYTLSIPKIDITDAYVTTEDYNVGKHLVNYGGTAVPPDKGNAVIFGHSTLPQLFNPKDYKTIFAKLHTIEKGDSLIVSVDGTRYTYKVYAIDIVPPDDFAPLMQHYDDSYLTVITCTPPGTIWERLVVSAKLVKET
ncbi:MAG: hypothetical protein RLZZ455_1125 [Candidatus Parcubacteria bacterium]|jgi:sortase A